MLLRPGMITYEMLCEVLGRVDIHPSVLENDKVDKAASPGMKYKHYSPKARVIIVNADEKTVSEFYDFAKNNNKNPVILWAEEKLSFFKNRNTMSLYSNNDTKIAAKNLFKLLRECDKKGFDTVFITSVSEKGAGLSVMNRMLRAAAFTVFNENSTESDLKTALQIN